MLAAIRKFFRTPGALTRQRQQGAGQDDRDLEASSVGEAGCNQQPDDSSQQQQQQQQQAGDEGGRIKGRKISRRQQKQQQQAAAKLDSNRDKRRADKAAVGQGTNRGRGPACGGLGDSGSESSTSGSSSSSSSSSSSDTTTSSSSSGTTNSSCVSGNNSEPNNAAANSIQEEADRLHHAAAAALPGEGQPATSVAECGDCPEQQQQQTGHYDASESVRPSYEAPQTQTKARKKDFNLDFDDDDEEEDEDGGNNGADNDDEDDDDNFTAEDQNRVAFIAEVGNANANRQNHHHYHHHYHHSHGQQQAAASPANSGVQANATPGTMPSSASTGAPFQATAAAAAVTPGAMASSARKTDVDQLLTGATSVANQRRESVRGNLEELRVAESVNYRPVVYKYSFKIPDTPANMRVFTDPDDRRIEAIARSCDSQIHLEKLPVRAGGGAGGQGGSTLKMRKITIQSPDLHSLEKCCRQFDDRFKHFYVSGGLGLSGKSIQRVYVDELDN